MSFITCGYIGGPPGSPAAQAIQAFFGESDAAVGNGWLCEPLQRGGVLNVSYWPVAVPGVYRGESFAAGIPNVCRAGEHLSLNGAEYSSLVKWGVIRPKSFPTILPY
jgi:hypothetical protein